MSYMVCIYCFKQLKFSSQGYRLHTNSCENNPKSRHRKKERRRRERHEPDDDWGRGQDPDIPDLLGDDGGTFAPALGGRAECLVEEQREEVVQEQAEGTAAMLARDAKQAESDDELEDSEVALHCSAMDALNLGGVANLTFNGVRMNGIAGASLPPAQRPNDANSSVNTNFSSTSRGLRSSNYGAGRTVIKSYEELTGKKAGMPRPDIPVEVPAEGDPRGGFKSDFDFSFALWLSEEHVSSRAVNRLLSDPNVAPIKDLLSWGSAEQLGARFDAMGSELVKRASHWTKDRIDFPDKLGARSDFMRYRSVRAVVEFLMGYAGFKEDLVYAPYKAYTGDGARLYSELASADWWWKAQQKTPNEGATIVPLILASDKTQVTNHAGDLSAYPVYLTIGNLPARVRHSRKRPGSVLLAMLPTTKLDGELEDRDAALHELLARLFQSVEDAAQDGWEIRCADGHVRQCFPIIAAMTIDHEEQVKMTGVKAHEHCPLCLIRPRQREDFEFKAPWRTTKKTMAQHMLQEKLPRTAKTHQGRVVDRTMWVHNVPCFSWRHKYPNGEPINLHRAMMVDVLHQLLKGVLMHTLRWLLALLSKRLTLQRHGRVRQQEDRASKGVRQRKIGAAVREDDLCAIVNRRFECVPRYRNLRLFPRMTKVTQWTGNEQKSLLRQVVPVFAPLLEEAGAMDALRCLRAVVDFTILAMYNSHDDITLGYMELALLRIQEYKEPLRPYRKAAQPKKGKTKGQAAKGSATKELVVASNMPVSDHEHDGTDSESETDTAEKQTAGAQASETPLDCPHKPSESFCFPKWHSQVHYPDSIRWLGSANILGSEYGEALHPDMVKKPFQRTNRRTGENSWEDQIMNHTTDQFKQRATFDPLAKFRKPTVADHRERAEWHTVQPASKAKSIAGFFGWRRTASKYQPQLEPKVTTVAEVEEHLGPTVGRDFRHAVAVFVREARRTHITDKTEEVERVEADSEWAKGIRLQFHASLRCWKPTGRDPDDGGAIEQDIARCTPRWYNGAPRYDFIWVQEYMGLDVGGKQQDETSEDTEMTDPNADDAEASEREMAFGGRLPARLKFVLTVLDDGQSPNGQVRLSNSRILHGVFVELYEPKAADGLPDEVHGMTIIKPRRPSPWRGQLQGRRIYDLTQVHHTLHVVPLDEDKPDGEMFINNYVDFATYNSVYHPQWEELEKAKVAEMKATRLAKLAELMRRKQKQASREEQDARPRAR